MSKNPPLHDIELPELHQRPSTQPPLLPQKLDLFAGVKATVSVSAGTAAATVGELLSLHDGDVLTLDRALDAPFDVMLDGRVLARGQLVAVGEQFGVRICEVCAPLQS